MKKQICIIDYKLGNLFSVNQALINIGLDVVISSDKETILNADALVLPGVGAFGDAMNHLRNLDLIGPIKNAVTSNKPLLGICLGLQLLFSESEEFGLVKGLDIIKGKVTKFDSINLEGNKIKVPQIGWNNISPLENKIWENTPLQNITKEEYLYFVHSYYIVPEENVGLSVTNYDGHKYVSSILKNNIFACQFHPEKSGKVGLQIYNDWALTNNLK